MHLSIRTSRSGSPQEAPNLSLCHRHLRCSEQPEKQPTIPLHSVNSRGLFPSLRRGTVKWSEHRTRSQGLPSQTPAPSVALGTSLNLCVSRFEGTAVTLVIVLRGDATCIRPGGPLHARCLPPGAAQHLFAVPLLDLPRAQTARTSHSSR